MRDDDGHGWVDDLKFLPVQVLVDDPDFFIVLCLRADAFELADGDGAP